MFLVLNLLFLRGTTAFSAGGINNPSFSLSDRFKANCPADLASIAQFDPSLVTDGDINDGSNKESVWVAVFRSNNNLPSVLIKDDFMNAMRIATSVQSNESSDGTTRSTQVKDSSLIGQIDATGGVKARTPVAVAKLSPSSDDNHKYILDTMRCSLKKEDTDESCDGQSEHAEAISICIDELILNHLRSGNQFDKSIRTKATLVSGKLLDTRGFQEVTELSRDMATHVSSLEHSLAKYVERAVETVSRSPGARDRALQILSYLGKQEINESAESDNKGDEEEYDPWANVNFGRL